MDVPAEETLSTGNLSLPPEMVWAALCFLDGRSLATFEIASQGTRQAVLDNLELYKTLLVSEVEVFIHQASFCRSVGLMLGARQSVSIEIGAAAAGVR